ncbi:CBS domain-containing protein [bacterium]|nr:CBS domain-containing protein [bacterium]
MELVRGLAHTMLRVHPQDATVVLEGLPLEEAAAFLSRADPAAAAKILKHGAPHFAAAVLSYLDAPSAAELVEQLPPEVASGLLLRMEESVRAGLIASLSPKCARAVQSLLRFPPDVAGSLMDPRVFGLPEDLTVQETLQRMRADANGVLFNLYVLDRSDVLVGALNLRDLLTAAPADRIGTLMKSPVSCIQARADRAAILAHPAWQQFHSLPVVDERGVFLGAVRYRAYRRLEAESLDRGEDLQTPTVQALGELFSTGIGGVMGAMASALGSAPDHRRSSGR